MNKPAPGDTRPPRRCGLFRRHWAVPEYTETLTGIRRWINVRFPSEAEARTYYEATRAKP